VPEISEGLLFISLGLLFFFLILLPFLPGLLELFLYKDARPLDINLKISKDPAYFGRSFLRLLETSLRSQKNISGPEELSESTTLMLSGEKEEELRVFFPEEAEELEERMSSIVFFKGTTVIRKPVIFLKEVLVWGDLVLESPCTFRALYIRGDGLFKAPVKIVRWLHVEGTLSVKAPSWLGHSTFAGEAASLRAPTTFKRIFAPRISTSSGEGLRIFRKKQAEVRPESLGSRQALVFEGKKKPLIFEKDLFSEEKIELHGPIWVKGHIFSQKEIKIKNFVVLGEKGKIKSAIGKRGIKIEGPFLGYGYLHTEGRGLIKP